MRRFRLLAIVFLSAFIPVSAIAVPLAQQNPTTLAQAGLSLSGEWVFKLQNSRGQADESGAVTCTAESGEFMESVILTQKGNQLEVQVKPREGSFAPMLNSDGTLSGNQVSLKGDFNEFTGIVSRDGNQIAGTYTCGALNLPFFLIRQGSQTSGTSLQQPIQSRPSVSPPPRSNPAELLW